MRGKDLIMQTLLGGGSGGSGGGGGWPEAPDDGKTRLYITLQEGRTSPMVGVCPKGTVTVDWGDGTEPDVLTGTSTSTVKWTPNHAYDAPGNYVITMTVDGTLGFTGSRTSNEHAYILRHTSGADARNRVYQIALKKVVFGSGIVNIGPYSFMHCYSLGYVVIPEGVANIQASAFQYCYSLGYAVIPDGVATIYDSVFSGCSAAKWYDFTHCTSVPTMPNSGTFSGIPTDCEIRVPAALYDEWIAATNWATYASNIKAY